MCLGAISITSEREQVVDFTKPFMQKAYNILIEKPKEQASVFQFLSPLSKRVWVLVAATLFVLGENPNQKANTSVKIYSRF